jgi:uncharacterized protein (TIGR00304 family)
MLLVLAGFVLLAVGVAWAAASSRDSRGAAVIIIGPVPIAVGNDRRILAMAVVAAIAVLLAFLVLGVAAS